jgi:hypothetical protein
MKDNVMDRFVVYADTQTHARIFMWKTSALCESFSQKTYDELERCRMIWSVGEQDSIRILDNYAMSCTVNTNVEKGTTSHVDLTTLS